MRIFALLPLAAVLLACAPADPQDEFVAASKAAAAARSIEGSYVVTYVNEAEPVIGIEGHEPTVRIWAEGIHFQSQCIYENWEYSREDEDIETGPWDYGDEVVGMCARGLAPGEEAIIAAIRGADTVRFVSHGLWMGGDGGTVQMRFVPSEEDLASRAVDLTGEWRVTELDGSAATGEYGPIELSADWNNIWWEPSCSGQGVSYTIDGNNFDAPEPGNPGLVCDIGFPQELTQIWFAMAAADTVERTAEKAVRISGNGRSVTLVSQ